MTEPRGPRRFKTSGQEEIARSRAARAENLLNDELLQETLEHLRTRYHRAWEHSASEPASVRERIFIELNGLNDFVRALTDTAKAGRIPREATVGATSPDGASRGRTRNTGVV